MSSSLGGGGFLREVLSMGGTAASSTTAGGGYLAGGGAAGSVGALQRVGSRNSQAVKVILSEAYIRWCSEPDTLDKLETLARELLAAAKMPSQPRQQQQQQPSPSSSSSSSAMQAADAARLQRYSDPSTVPPQNATPDDGQRASGSAADAQRSTSPSPPPSPPMRQRTRKDVPPGAAADERRTPSPVQHSTRYLGVDELDTFHRAHGSGSSAGGSQAALGAAGSSPGGASPVSPTAMQTSGSGGGAYPFAVPQPPQKHTVDPHLPSPHYNTAAMMDTAVFLDGGASPPGSSLHIRGSSPTNDSSHPASHKFAPNAGAVSFAVVPDHKLPLASLHDVPSFYDRLRVDGSQKEVRLDELDALANHFSSSSLSGAGASGASNGAKPGGKAGASSSSLRGPGGIRAAPDIDGNRTVRKLQFGKICKEVFALPLWLKDCLYRKIANANGLTENQPLNYHHIKKFYDTSFGRLSENRRLFEVLRQNPRSNVLTMDDLKHGVKYLVESHPGLEFLKQPEFQDSYCRTVAIRIVYELEDRQQRCVTWQHFDRSDLPDVMRSLDDTADINLILRYFSYEHFYVLYCRFWELDTDRDQLIGLQELQQYSQGSLTTAVLQRVEQGAGRKLSSGVPHKLDFEDFIYFCLSEEDKNHPQAVYYWFKVLDIDGDGILSGYELGKFFDENRQRFLDAIGDELKYEDMLCQMLDMVGANKIREHKFGLTLSDLRTCDTPANFFNMIFNANKFLNFEHRDPFAEHQLKANPEKTDWDRFARVEYDRMANEVS